MELNIAKIKDGIFIGDKFAGTTLSILVQFKISHIINTCGNQILYNLENTGIKYLTYNWPENPSNNMVIIKDEISKKILHFIDNSLLKGSGIMIFSLKGQNRACVAVIIYLMKKYNWSLKKCREYLASKKKDVRDAIETNIPGFSLGIKKGNYNFKQQRKEEVKNRERELENAILENTMTLHIKKEPLFKQNKDFSLYEENKKENLKELIIRIKEKEEEGKEKRKDNLKLLEDLQKQKIKEIEDKEEKYQKKYEEREKKLNRSHSGLYYSRNHLSKKIIKSSEIPKEKLYDVRTKYDKNKGWSFGMKYNINLNQKKDDPDFPYLLSDFDKITSKPKNVEIKFRIPRFKEIPKAKPNTAKLRDHINDETREKIRKMGERNKIIKSFLNERKRDLERVLENKGINEEEREQRIGE